MTITAAPDATDINIEDRLIPMTVLRIETVQSGTVETNGTQETGVVRALGTVTFTNQTLGGVDVPEGTVVRTSSDPAISFRTVEDATVPAGNGNTADVSIEALQDFAGEVGNIPAGAINTVTGPLSDQLTVTNPEATFGGESETESVVSAGDVDRLESIVRQQVQSQAYTEMLPRLTDTQTVMLETLTIVEERDDWKTFSATPGDAVETLSLQMRAVVQATVIDQQFAQTVASPSLVRRSPASLSSNPTRSTTRSARSPMLPPAAALPLPCRRPPASSNPLTPASSASKSPGGRYSKPSTFSLPRLTYNRTPPHRLAVARLGAALARAAHAYSNSNRGGNAMIGRLLGIDHGLSRVGVAVSDALGITAKELALIDVESDEQTYAELQRLAQAENAAAFVVGVPSNEGNTEQADIVREWANGLRGHITLPVVLWDEQLSSADAKALAKQQKRSPAPLSTTSPPASSCKATSTPSPTVSRRRQRRGAVSC